VPVRTPKVSRKATLRLSTDLNVIINLHGAHAEQSMPSNGRDRRSMLRNTRSLVTLWPPGGTLVASEEPAKIVEKIDRNGASKRSGSGRAGENEASAPVR
jgi:hypothetical protein